MKSVKFVYHRTVKIVEQRFRTEWVSGVGKDAKTREVSEGWFVVFAEEPTAMYLGTTETDLKVGDRMQLTLELKSRPTPAVVLPITKGAA